MRPDMIGVRASAGVGEPGRAVNPLPQAESVRIAPRPSEIVFAPGRWTNQKQLGARVDLERALTERDGRLCFYCDAEIGGWSKHVDHVVPARAGGSDSIENLVFACARCNLRKGLLPGWYFMLTKRVAGLADRPRDILLDFALIPLQAFCVGAENPDNLRGASENAQGGLSGKSLHRGGF